LKTRTIISISLLLLLSCNPKGSNGYKNAATYNNHIIDQQKIVMTDIASFSRALGQNIDSAENLLSIYRPQLDSIVSGISNMPDFKGDVSLRNSATDLFTFYRKLFTDDYENLIIYWREHERNSPEGMAEANRVIQKISIEEEQYDKSFHKAQKEFAEKFDVKLNEENR